MPFKISTKSEEFVVFCGAYWVKTFFFRCHNFIEIWFLNKNWTQKLSFWKIFFFQSMLIRKVFYSKSAGTKNSQFKIWLFEIFLLNFSLCRKTFASESDSFFQRISFQTLNFNGNACFKIMAFKISTKSEKFVVFCGGNQIKTLFVRCDVLIEIWFLNKNWTQNLFLGNYLFSTNSIFKKFCFRNLPEWKTLNWKPDILEIFLFQIFFVQENVCFRICFFFSESFISNSDFQWESLYKVMPFKMSTQTEKLVVSAEQIESKCFFSDVNFSSKPDFSLKIEFKNWVSGKNFFSRIWYSKCFVFEICRNEKFSIQNLTFWNFFFSNFHCTGKRLLQNLILFFGKFHFKLWFSMKEFATKSCLLKWARKVKNLLLSAEQNESKRFFFRCEFFIETCFLNKNWIQKLSFWKIFLPQKLIIRNVLYPKSAELKILNSEPDILEFFLFKFSLCRKTFAS